jgi:MFS family permease
VSSATTTLVRGRALRGFADGFVSVLLAQYLVGLGLSPFEVGVVVTATLVGSAALTLAFGLVAHRTGTTALLIAACVLMAGTGVGFATFTTLGPIVVVALVGTLNPSAGDVSVFLPTEQAFLAGEVTAAERPRLFARYNVGGTLAGALGALLSGVPALLSHRYDWDLGGLQRLGFVGYTAVAVVLLITYRTLPARHQTAAVPGATRSPLGSSRTTVLRLAALFSLDSAGSGFVVTSMLVLWLHLRFDLSPSTTATVFFASGLLGGCSQLLAPRVVRRFGLVRTMVVTHIPANLFLAATPFAPNGTIAIGLLLARALVAQMDVPARQAFVMSIVPPEVRAAASSITNVPRSLASAATPLAAGALLARSTFGWPLLLAGLTKLAYDVLLLVLHRHTPEEHEPTPAVVSP